MACASPRGEGPLLKTQSGLPYRYAGIRSAWVRACERARIEDLNIHDLRGRAGVDQLTGTASNAPRTQSLILACPEGLEPPTCCLEVWSSIERHGGCARSLSNSGHGRAHRQDAGRQTSVRRAHERVAHAPCSRLQGRLCGVCCCWRRVVECLHPATSCPSRMTAFG
jgi:hypothetical protein